MKRVIISIFCFSILLASCSYEQASVMMKKSPVSKRQATVLTVRMNFKKTAYVPAPVSNGAFIDWHYIAAYFYLYQGNIKKALNEFEIIMPFVDKPFFYNEYVDMLFYVYRINDAVRVLDVAIKMFPDNATFYLRKASALVALNHLNAAIKILKKAYVLFPKNEHVLKMLGSLYINNNNYSLGINFLNKAVIYAKNKGDVYFYMAQVFKNLGFYDKATKNAKMAIKSNSKRVEYILLLGSIYESENFYERAINLYKKFQVLNSDVLYSAIGNDYYKIRNYEHSLQYFRKALSVAPNNVSYIEKVSYMYIKLKQYLKLIQFSKHYGDVFAQSDNLKYMAGFSYAQLGNCKEAISVFKTIKANSNIFLDAVNNEVACYAKLKNYNTAIGILKKSIKYYPTYEFLYYKLSYIYSTKGLYDDAINILKKGIGYIRDKSKFYFYIADIYFENKHDINEAIKYLKESIKSNPKNSEALNYLGYLYINHNIKINEGMKLVKSALTIEPESPAYLDSLGWGYYKTKNYKKALLYLQKAIKILGGKIYDPIIELHLAKTYYKLKLKKESKHWIYKILRHFPHNKKAKEFLKKLK